MSPPITEPVPVHRPGPFDRIIPAPIRASIVTFVQRHVPLPIRRLTGRHWAWIHFKIVALVWMANLIRFPPEVTTNALGWVAVLIGGATIAGALISVIGIVLSAQPGKTGAFGIGIEFSGLILMFLGPLAYTAIQAWLVDVLPNGDQRIALAWLAYLVCAAFICRIVIVAPRWWATRPSKTAAPKR